LINSVENATEDQTMNFYNQDENSGRSWRTSRPGRNRKGSHVACYQRGRFVSI